MFAGSYYYTCDAFHLFVKWKVGSESFVIVNATEEARIAEKLGAFHLYESVYGPPCSWAYIYASGPGQTMLQATLSKEHHLDQSFHGSIILKASSRIAAYPPLTVHQVVDGSQFGGYWLDLGHVEASNHLEPLESLYLVPGTSLDIMLLGGPAPWDKDVDYLETVEISGDKHASSKDGIHARRISGSYQSMYRVSCQTLGIFVSYILCSGAIDYCSSFCRKHLYCALFTTKVVTFLSV
jgi:nuclear pore complex protein Nup210